MNFKRIIFILPLLVFACKKNRSSNEDNSKKTIKIKKHVNDPGKPVKPVKSKVYSLVKVSKIKHMGIPQIAFLLDIEKALKNEVLKEALVDLEIHDLKYKKISSCLGLKGNNPTNVFKQVIGFGNFNGRLFEKLPKSFYLHYKLSVETSKIFECSLKLDSKAKKIKLNGFDAIKIAKNGEIYFLTLGKFDIAIVTKDLANKIIPGIGILGKGDGKKYFENLKVDGSVKFIGRNVIIGDISKKTGGIIPKVEKIDFDGTILLKKSFSILAYMDIKDKLKAKALVGIFNLGLNTPDARNELKVRGLNPDLLKKLELKNHGSIIKSVISINNKTAKNLGKLFVSFPRNTDTK
jgi:hypothetical protein